MNEYTRELQRDFDRCCKDVELLKGQVAFLEHELEWWKTQYELLYSAAEE